MTEVEKKEMLPIMSPTEAHESEEDFFHGTIMRTKLYRPPIGPDAVHRDRLLKLLSDSRRILLTVIQASAGYGKSILARSFAASLDEPNAWLSLDEGDNNPRRFLLHFIAAVRSMFAGSCSSTLDLLKAPDFPPLDVLTQHVINDLDCLDGHFTLFLDDYHYIDNKEIHDLLNEMFKHPPRGLHIVLMTRTTPHLALSFLRAKGSVVEITENKLRFTLEEAALFLKNNLDVAPDEEDLELIDEKIEGWAVGLRLLAFALHDQSDVTSFLNRLHGDSTHIAEYLTAEVSARQSPAFEHALIRSSIPDRFCASLCEALNDRDTSCEAAPNGPARNGAAPSGRDFISHLKSSGMFVVPLDGENRWFRYHYMVRELLQKQLEEQIGQEAILRLHGRAAKWFADNNHIDEAIRHMILGGELDGAVRLVENHRRDALAKDEWYLLKDWLEKIPDDVFILKPGLLMARAWVYFHQFRLPEIPPILDAVEALLKDGESDLSLRGEMDFLRGFFLNVNNKSEEATTYFENARRLIPRSYDYARGMNELHFGIARHMNGSETVSSELRQLLRESPAAGDIFRSRIHGGLLYIPLLQGALRSALRAVDELDAAADRMNSAYARLWSNYLRGNIALMMNDLPTAERCFTYIYDKRYQLLTRTAVDALVGLAFAYQLSGRPDKADETVTRLRWFIGRSETPANAIPVDSCRARLSILRGDASSAAAWADTADLSIDSGFMFFWIEFSRLTQCRAWIAARTLSSLRRAEEALANYLALCRRTHNTYQAIQILSLQSSVYHALGDRERATAAFSEAAHLAAPGGFILPFLETGDATVELLDSIKKDPSVADWCDGIRAAFETMREQSALSCSSAADEAPKERLNEPVEASLTASSHRDGERSSVPQVRTRSASPPSVVYRSESSDDPPVDPLTFRETEILTLLADGLRNKEIAKRLFVSTETVKKHLYNMYQKLDVHSRGELVAKFLQGRFQNALTRAK